MRRKSPLKRTAAVALSLALLLALAGCGSKPVGKNEENTSAAG